MPQAVSDEPNPHSGYGRVNLVGSLPKRKDPYSGYGIGAADEDDEDPFHLEIPIPEPTTKDGASVNFKVTLTYADLPGGALQNDLNLLVVVGGEQRHGNQSARQSRLDRRRRVAAVGSWYDLGKRDSVGHISKSVY